jgi:hypothetical protein
MRIGARINDEMRPAKMQRALHRPMRDDIFLSFFLSWRLSNQGVGTAWRKRRIAKGPSSLAPSSRLRRSSVEKAGGQRCGFVWQKDMTEAYDAAV